MKQIHVFPCLQEVQVGMREWACLAILTSRSFHLTLTWQPRALLEQ